MPVVAYLYKHPAHAQSSNGGVSVASDYVTVYGRDEPFVPTSFSFLGDRAPPVRLAPSNLIVGGVPQSVVAYPLDPETGERRPGRHMYGGVKLDSNSGLLADLVAQICPHHRYAGAVNLHDRVD